MKTHIKGLVDNKRMWAPLALCLGCFQLLKAHFPSLTPDPSWIVSPAHVFPFEEPPRMLSSHPFPQAGWASPFFESAVPTAIVPHSHLFSCTPVDRPLGQSLYGPPSSKPRAGPQREHSEGDVKGTERGAPASSIQWLASSCFLLRLGLEFTWAFLGPLSLISSAMKASVRGDEAGVTWRVQVTKSCEHSKILIFCDRNRKLWKNIWIQAWPCRIFFFQRMITLLQRWAKDSRTRSKGLPRTAVLV